MSVKIDINTANIMQRVDHAWKAGLADLTNEVREDCNEYCKRAEGGLIASSETNSRLEEGLVIWDTPYAKRQYWEIQTAYTEKNPNATWKWCEAAKTVHLGDWQKKAQEGMDQNL